MGDRGKEVVGRGWMNKHAGMGVRERRSGGWVRGVDGWMDGWDWGRGEREILMIHSFPAWFVRWWVCKVHMVWVEID